MTAPIIGQTTAAGTTIFLAAPIQCRCGRMVMIAVNRGGRTGCVWCAGVGR